MILHETTNPPTTISLNGMPPQSMKVRLATFSIDEEESMIKLHDELSKGRDIVIVVQGAHSTYVTVREFIKSDIALNAKPGELK